VKILTGIDVPFQPFGGSLVFCDNFYSSLPDDVEVRFLTLRPPTDEQWWSIKDVVFLDIEKTRDPARYPEYISKLTELVQEQIDEFQPDIIHCQHLNYGLSRAFVDAQTTAPRLGLCHGTDVQAASSSDVFRKNLAHICDQLDEIAFPNQIMADDTLAVHPTTTPYSICPYGIPDRYFHPNPMQFTGSERLEVLYAGRLLAWKGPDIAVEAMAHTKANIHLTVIGNQDQAGYPEQMHEFVKRHGLSDRVTFVPQLPRDELVASFSKYDVMVLPSRRLEAFSLAAVEAQANGLPLIYAAGGGIESTVGDGGIRLTANTPEVLGRTLDEAYRRPELLANVRRKGLANAEKYRLSVSSERLLRLSRELIARGAKTLPRS
jgi:glycosyltransferase involved in cell wall biosynthesis